MTAFDDLFPAFPRRRDPELQEQFDRVCAMTVDERIAAMRAGRLTYQQLCHWSAHRPDQVPRISTGSGGAGEFEWLAMFESSIAEADDTPTHTASAAAGSVRGRVARVTLTAVDLTIDGQRQRSSTTIGSVGAYALVVATALPDHGITLTSCYLADMRSDIAATHLCSAPARPARIQQRVLPGRPPGEAHARACLLDHAAELHTVADELDGSTVTIDVAADALHQATRVWATEPPPNDDH